jgi:hypothetical protein
MTEDEELEVVRKVIPDVSARTGVPEVDILRALLKVYAKGKEDGRKAAMDESVVTSAVVPESREVWGYSSSREPETWEGEFKTREEVIAEGRSEFGPEDFWIMRGTWPDPAKYVPDVVSVLDQMSADAGDEGGDAAEDYPDVSKEGEEALGMLLRAWARQYARPTFWVADGEPELVKTP